MAELSMLSVRRAILVALNKVSFATIGDGKETLLAHLEREIDRATPSERRHALNLRLSPATVPSPEPKRPEPSKGAVLWLELHPEVQGTASELSERDDLSHEMREYVTAMTAWRVERDEWANRQPIDYDTMLGRAGGWRMLGGPWIRQKWQFEEVDIAIGDDTYVRVTESAHQCAREACDRLDPDGFREWAIGMYERLAMRSDAEADYVLHLRAGAGRRPL